MPLPIATPNPTPVAEKSAPIPATPAQNAAPVCKSADMRRYLFFCSGVYFGATCAKAGITETTLMLAPNPRHKREVRIFMVGPLLGFLQSHAHANTFFL